MELRQLVLWVTTDCNLRCRYCYADGGTMKEYMGWAVAKKALDFAHEHGFSRGVTVEFAGGEPLLALDLIERIVGYTRGWNVRFQVQTNATLISPHVAARVGQLGLRIGVSLDGVPPINDNLRPFADGSGSSTAVLAGIERLRKRGMTVGLTCVLSAENVRGLPQLVDLASYLGNVERIQFDLLRNVGRASGAVRPAPLSSLQRAVGLVLKRADELAALGGRRVVFQEVERVRHLLALDETCHHRCQFDTGEILAVTPGGEAFPCASLVPFPVFSLGHITAPGFGEDLQQRLRAARDRIAPMRTCLTCDNRSLCGGPCPAHTFTWRLTGEESLAECAVRRTVINYVRESNCVKEAIGLPV